MERQLLCYFDNGLCYYVFDRICWECVYMCCYCEECFYVYCYKFVFDEFGISRFFNFCFGYVYEKYNYFFLYDVYFMN